MRTPPPLEEVPKNIEYVPCGGCFGARIRPPCGRCAGWGYVVDPPDISERIRLGLQALMPTTILDVTQPRRRLVLPSRRRKRP